MTLGGHESIGESIPEALLAHSMAELVNAKPEQLSNWCFHGNDVFL